MPQPIRIHVTSHMQANEVWQLLRQVDAFEPVELWLDGVGLLYLISRAPDGQLTTQQPDRLVRNSPQAVS
jgi:hypothetical protein